MKKLLSLALCFMLLPLSLTGLHAEGNGEVSNANNSTVQEPQAKAASATASFVLDGDTTEFTVGDTVTGTVTITTNSEYRSENASKSMNLSILPMGMSPDFSTVVSNVMINETNTEPFSAGFNYQLKVESITEDELKIPVSFKVLQKGDLKFGMTIGLENTKPLLSYDSGDSMKTITIVDETSGVVTEPDKVVPVVALHDTLNGKEFVVRTESSVMFEYSNSNYSEIREPIKFRVEYSFPEESSVAFVQNYNNQQKKFPSEVWGENGGEIMLGATGISYSGIVVTPKVAGTYSYSVKLIAVDYENVVAEVSGTFTVSEAGGTQEPDNPNPDQPQYVASKAINGWEEYLGDGAPEKVEIDGYYALKFGDAKGGYVTKSEDVTLSLSSEGSTVSTDLYLDLDAMNQGDLFVFDIALNGEDGNTVASTEYNILAQKSNGVLNAGTKTGVITESGVYTYAFTAYDNGTVVFELKQGDTVLYTEEHKADPATEIRYLWLFGAGGTIAEYQLQSPVYIVTGKVPSQDENVNASTEKEESSTVSTVNSTWDDGGPFTTDSCGSVYDRWGNVIYQGTCSVNGQPTGFQLVNTADR